jgi:hypothetical protein
MTVINALYLPRDERLRTIVRTALDFVEEVYRDEFLSDLKFVSFNMFDYADQELAKTVAVAEGFDYEVVHRRCRYRPWPPSFFRPHYITTKRYVWVPVYVLDTVFNIFYTVVHEVIHHVFYKLPEEDRNDVIYNLRRDLGVDVDEMIRMHGVSAKWVKQAREIVDEAIALYIADNYFVNLEREPRTPTHQTRIKIYAEWQLTNLVFRPPRSRDFFEALSMAYLKLAHQDLAGFRGAVHGAFAKTIKRFPVDVLESNRAKYEILYSGEPASQWPR